MDSFFSRSFSSSLTKEELIESMQIYAQMLKASCTRYIDIHSKEKLYSLFNEYKERFDSSASLEDDMIWNCHYPCRITSSLSDNVINLQKEAFYKEIKVIESLSSKYVYFEIRTDYSEECYFAPAKYESLEYCADDFLAEICFCDAYEITLVRYATEEECNALDDFLKLDIVPDGYWDKGEEMCLLEARNCYFEDQERNNIKRGKKR